jgi:hypothetical protein
MLMIANTKRGGITVNTNYGQDLRATKRSRFMQAAMLGALAGALISLFDRNTRKSVLASSKRYMGDMKSIVTNPDSTLNQLKETSGKLRATIEQISEDVAFISARVEEIKEIPPQVAHVVKETKDAFTTDEHFHHVNSQMQH